MAWLTRPLGRALFFDLAHQSSIHDDGWVRAYALTHSDITTYVRYVPLLPAPSMQILRPFVFVSSGRHHAIFNSSMDTCTLTPVCRTSSSASPV